MPLTRNVAVNIPNNSASSTVATSVAASTTSVALLASNSNRKGATFWNVSADTLRLECGATASATLFTALLGSGDFFELPFGYTGAVSGVWTGTNGDVKVREFI
jgi:hypothetical protein